MIQLAHVYVGEFVSPQFNCGELHNFQLTAQNMGEFFVGASTALFSILSIHLLVEPIPLMIAYL